MEKLSNDEMKKVMGGVAAQVTCSCYGSVGAWEYTDTPTGNQTLDDIADYCRSGYGSCSDGASIMPAA